KAIKEFGDEFLVERREIDARRLRAVSQCRVEEIEAVLTHRPCVSGGQRSASWSGCWWLVARMRARRAASDLSSSVASPGSAASSLNHGMRDSVPYWTVGFTCSGWSSEPIEAAIHFEVK